MNNTDGSIIKLDKYNKDKVLRNKNAWILMYTIPMETCVTFPDEIPMMQ